MKAQATPALITEDGDTLEVVEDGDVPEILPQRTPILEIPAATIALPLLVGLALLVVYAAAHLRREHGTAAWTTGAASLVALPERMVNGTGLREMPPPFEVYVQTRPERMMYDRDPGNRKMADHAVLRAEVERILKLMRRDRLDFLNLGITPDAYRQNPDYLARLKDGTDRLKRDGLIRFASADTFRGEETYLRMIASRHRLLDPV